MPTFFLDVHEDLAAYRECHRCFWLKHKHHNAPPRDGAFPPLEETAKLVVLEYFDRYRGAVPAYFHGELDGKLVDDEDRIAAWRNPRKGLSAPDQYGNSVLRGWMDDCFVDEDELHTPAFISFVNEEPNHEEMKERQMIYDGVVFLLNANKRKTTDFVYQFYYVPDKILKAGGIGLSAKAVRVEADPSRAEDLFNDAAELLRSHELPAADAYCQLCAWFAERNRRITR